MAILGSGKNNLKGDINFFAAFTESARKAARALAYVIIIGLIVFGIFLVWLIADIARNFGESSKIASLKAELASEEYAGLERESYNLEQELAAKNQYYYALTAMQQQVAETPAASIDLADLIGESIPSDSYVSTYSISGTECKFAGYSFNYYSALNMVNILQGSDVFESLDVTVKVVETPPSNGEDDEVNPMDIYYEFQISGNLTSDAYLTIVRFNDNNGVLTPLGGIETFKYTTGDKYEISEISTITDSNGNVYTLDRIAIDNSVMTDDEFNAAVENDSINGTLNQSTEVQLFYTVQAATEAEGGEA